MVHVLESTNTIATLIELVVVKIGFPLYTQGLLTLK